MEVRNNTAIKVQEDYLILKEDLGKKNIQKNMIEIFEAYNSSSIADITEDRSLKTHIFFRVLQLI